MKAKSENTAKKTKKVSAESKKTVVRASVQKAVRKTAGPSENDIRVKAEELYRERIAKNIPGTEEGDWLAAEKMLKGLK